MLTLLQNITCYGPEPYGNRDLLIASGKIETIAPPGSLLGNPLIKNSIDGNGLFAFPGIIDQHVHILGGGGEQGFASRVPEIDGNEILRAGVTTVVGLLGADGTTRSLEALYAKAMALEAQNVTAYLYSGSYTVPAVTFTNDVTRDLLFIDKVIGIGEIAVSDHRSSCPSLQELLRIASAAHLGGLLGGKAGVVHFHIGDGKDGLTPITRILDCSDLPKEELVPTHTNRNPSLFADAVNYCRAGGNIDLTAGESAGVAVPDAVRMLINGCADLTRVTVSSDAGGSIPGGGVAKIQALYDDIIRTIRSGISPETAFRLVTENVAKLLKLYPQKGVIQPGSDADILVTDADFNIKMLFCRGKPVIEN